jgi:hypothetical protein
MQEYHLRFSVCRKDIFSGPFDLQELFYKVLHALVQGKIEVPLI